MHGDELRKLAEDLRKVAAEQESARMKKAAHTLFAAKGLLVMGQKKKAWYEPNL